jgi:hypothetical protein
MEEKNTRQGVYCRCRVNDMPETESQLSLPGFLNDLLMDFDYTPSRIVKSGPCTIVFWQDGTKTVVRCPADTIPNDYEAFTAALAIKIFGTNSQVKKLIQRLTVIQPPKEKKKKDEPVESMLDGETE